MYILNVYLYVLIVMWQFSIFALFIIYVIYMKIGQAMCVWAKCK